ncbi:cytochrome oxidase assembly [Neolentinus lepideus HHB14362 ss-1]|uniref:Cytochrome oxidase assembly n=1 Tax=Neolentinus lepideus HHB14362 ss-1 TaxID=1314782 RepID=A0A165TMF6_9AGAM|nr:cytochrome oxidase assembly [Neolentinus lepideus HHB14362 ss-1]
MFSAAFAKAFRVNSLAVKRALPCVRAIHSTPSVIGRVHAQIPGATAKGLRGILKPSRCYAALANQAFASAKVKSLEPRFFSSNSAQQNADALAPPLPTLSPPAVGRWLLFSSALVFAVIVVGGVTRLTESGLSITEWKPITGILPPLSQDEWEAEFEKYKATPEFKLLNHSISLDEFKSIFWMEWSHRVLGRIIGITFVVPLAYFALRKQLTSSLPRQLIAMAALIGLQGFLGWYMVKSGLEDSILETNSIPRVSQYRLAAHLGTAFVLYAGMLGTGLAALFDWKYATKGAWSGLKDGASWKVVLANPQIKRFSRASWVLTSLVFLTALSGAFVAGLDAGLVYNEFPLMGGRLAPPANELFDPAYAKDPSGSDIWWRNIFENPTTVQFDHRLLATTTYFATAALYLASRRPAYQTILTPMAKRFAAVAFGVANIQVILGISTLLYLVPVSLAACHQAGSVALLTSMIHLLVALRRPGAAARAWRQSSMAVQRQRKA